MTEGPESRSGGVGAEVRGLGKGLSELEPDRSNFDDPYPLQGAVSGAHLNPAVADTGGAAAAQGALGTLRVGPDEGAAGTSS